MTNNLSRPIDPLEVALRWLQQCREATHEAEKWQRYYRSLGVFTAVLLAVVLVLSAALGSAVIALMRAR